MISCMLNGTFISFGHGPCITHIKPRKKLATWIGLSKSRRKAILSTRSRVTCNSMVIGKNCTVVTKSLMNVMIEYRNLFVTLYYKTFLNYNILMQTVNFLLTLLSLLAWKHDLDIDSAPRGKLVNVSL